MVQCEVTEKATVCEVPPEKGTRLYQCNMQSDPSAERNEQQVFVSEIAPRESTRLSDGAKVVHVESGAGNGMQTVASSKGVPCETEAGSSRPGGVIKQKNERETTLELKQGNDLSDVEREDNESSPKCSEDITLMKPDSTASEGELLLKVFPTDSVGNVSEGEKVHCEAVVGVQTGTSSVEGRFEEMSNPSSMNRVFVVLETCLVQQHVNDRPEAKNYPQIEKNANFQEFRSVEGPDSGFVRGCADKLARQSNAAGKLEGKGCRNGGAQAHLNCRVADDATREVCNNQRKVSTRAAPLKKIEKALLCGRRQEAQKPVSDLFFERRKTADVYEGNSRARLPENVERRGMLAASVNRPSPAAHSPRVRSLSSPSPPLATLEYSSH
ncbi:hypothetical protein HPB51_025488 [Rhipicephalus microplus]|uniref:Uncharacterized protein n=1 Tax=Rhipicephalus microplus TaxID=6941 RepID=A0A9J6DRG5_RHIMP|nr:hypothetical protein HPB51_025488 [Rhipicephalus microplus]